MKVSRWGRGAVVAAVIAQATLALAQQPVCPPPRPDLPVYDVCIPNARYAVSPLLTTLSVDHVLRAQNPVRREPRSIFAAVAGESTQQDNPELKTFLDGLEPFQLERLDLATGMLRMHVPDDHRSLRVPVKFGGMTASLAIDLPERIEGGYWRNPGALQVAFWKDRRASFTLTTDAAGEVSAEVECLAISSDRIRIVTTGEDKPDVLIRLGDCP